ncbi:MAG: S8 family serine peptidase [Actinomycetota bacterium]|nr:S8 family serine peptidase [Actinomycetota bacterium]
MSTPPTATAKESTDLASQGFAATTTGRLLVRFRDDVAPELGEASAAQSGARNAKRSSATGWTAVEAADGVTLETLRDTLALDPAIEAVEIEHRVFPSMSVDDPIFSQQWGLNDTLRGHDISAPEAWDLMAERALPGDAIVAVVDSGVEFTHPDLAGNLWVNAGETPANDVDDDHNGYIDDTSGWDFYGGDADPTDTFGHGTHVAGIIAARTDNATGVASVAGPQNPVRIMPISIFNGGAGGSTLQAAEALRYAVDNGASVINVSWGGPDPDTVMAEAVDYAEQHGVILVCAAGNSSTSNEVTPFYPSSFDNDNIIAVAASTSSGTLASFSNRGAVSVDLAAPGLSILSTYVDGRYVEMSGTSMATPHVTGAVALLGLRFPSEWWGSHRLRILELSRPESALAGYVASGAALDLPSALATISPDGDSQLASGAACVNVNTVSMRSDVYGSTQMAVDSEGDGSFEATSSFDPLLEIDLTPGDGTKTVSVRYAGEVAQILELTHTIVVDTVAPDAPTDLSAAPLNRGAQLSWKASASDDVVGYAVWGAANEAGPFVRVDQHPTTGTSYTALGLENGSTYHFRVSAVDAAGNEGVQSGTMSITPEFRVDRVQGAERYATAVALSAKSFASAETVVVTTGEAFPDAVVASALAGAVEGPLLFARAGSLPLVTADEIMRLGASRVVIVGGVNVVSDEVVDALDALAGVTTVDRVAGSSRYETSAEVAREVWLESGTRFPHEAFVVRGDSFPDAVSVASAAYSQVMPVLLVRPTSAPWSVAQAARDTELNRVFVAGGQQAVSDQVMASFALPYTRAQGPTRYETSVAVAEMAIERGWSDDAHIGVASGEQFADALSGGAALGEQSGVVVLSRADSVPWEVASFVNQHASGVAAMWLLGGELALSDNVLDALEAAAR